MTANVTQRADLTRQLPPYNGTPVKLSASAPASSQPNTSGWTANTANKLPCIDSALKSLIQTNQQSTTKASGVFAKKDADLAVLLGPVDQLPNNTKALITKHLEEIETCLQHLSVHDKENRELIYLQIRQCLIRVTTHRSNGDILVKLFEQCKISVKFAVENKDTFPYVVEARKSIITREIETFIQRKQKNPPLADDEKTHLSQTTCMLFGVGADKLDDNMSLGLSSYFSQEEMIAFESHLTTALFPEAVAAQMSITISMARNRILHEFQKKNSGQPVTEQAMKNCDVKNNSDFLEQFRKKVIRPLAIIQNQKEKAVLAQSLSMSVNHGIEIQAPHRLEFQDTIMDHFRSTLGATCVDGSAIGNFSLTGSTITITQLSATKFAATMIGEDRTRHNYAITLSNVIAFIEQKPGGWNQLTLEQQCNMVRCASLTFLQEKNRNPANLANLIFQFYTKLDLPPVVRQACVGIITNSCVFCTDSHAKKMLDWLFTSLCTQTNNTTQNIALTPAETLCKLWGMQDMHTASQFVIAEVEKIKQNHPSTWQSLNAGSSANSDHLCLKNLLLFAVRTKNNQLVQSIIKCFASPVPVLCPDDVSAQGQMNSPQGTSEPINLSSSSRPSCPKPSQESLLYLNPNYRSLLDADTALDKPLISFAAARGDCATLSTLLCHKMFTPQWSMSIGERTPFHAACYSDSGASLNTLLTKKPAFDQAGITLSTRDKLGTLPIHVACCSGNLEAVKIILAQSGDKALNEPVDDVRVLKGLDESERAEINTTPQELLSASTKDTTVAIFKKQEASHFSLMSTSQQQAGTSSSVPKHTGGCAIHCACFAEKNDTVLWLIDNHPDLLTQRDNWGRTALHIALQRGDQDLAREIIKRVNIHNMHDIFTMTDSDGNNPFHLAAKIADNDLIQEMCSFTQPDVVMVFRAAHIAKQANAKLPQTTSEAEAGLTQLCTALQQKNNKGHTPRDCTLLAVNSAGAECLFQYGVDMETPCSGASKFPSRNSLLLQLLFNETQDGSSIKDKFIYDDILLAMCKQDPKFLTTKLGTNPEGNIFHFCCAHNKWHLLEKLIAISDDVNFNEKNGDNESVLFLVCRTGRMTLVEQMISAQTAAIPLNFLQLSKESEHYPISYLIEFACDAPSSGTSNIASIHNALDYALGCFPAVEIGAQPLTIHEKLKILLTTSQQSLNASQRPPLLLTATRHGGTKAVAGIIGTSSEKGYAETKVAIEFDPLTNGQTSSSEWTEITVDNHLHPETEETPLHTAVRKQDLPLLKMLLETQTEFNGENNSGYFGLSHLINHPNEDGNTPLHLAAQLSEQNPNSKVAAEIESYLFEQQQNYSQGSKGSVDKALVKPTTENPEGDTCYHADLRALRTTGDQVPQSDSKIKRVLNKILSWLNSVAKKTGIGYFINYQGENAWHVFLSDQRPFDEDDMGLVFDGLLEDKTLNLNRKRNKDGHSPVSLALQSNLPLEKKEAILKERRCDLTQKIKGQSLLHIVAAKCDRETIEMFIRVIKEYDNECTVPRVDFDPNAPSKTLQSLLCSCDKEGNTPLHVALSRTDVDYISVSTIAGEIEREKCTEQVLKVTNISKQSILHLAAQCSENAFQCVVKMVSKEASLQSQVIVHCQQMDTNGCTPIQYACDKNFPKQLHTLLQFISGHIGQEKVTTNIGLPSPLNYLLMIMQQYANATQALTDAANAKATAAQANTNATNIADSAKTASKTKEMLIKAEARKKEWRNVVQYMLQLPFITEQCKQESTGQLKINLTAGTPGKAAIDHAIAADDYETIGILIDNGATLSEEHYRLAPFTKCMVEVRDFLKQSGVANNSDLCKLCKEGNLTALKKELEVVKQSHYQTTLNKLQEELTLYNNQATESSMSISLVSHELLSKIDKLRTEFNQRAQIKKESINNSDMNGDIPLLVAVKHGSTDVAKFLMDKSECKFDLTDKNNKTVLHLAAETGNVELMSLIIEKVLKSKNNQKCQLLAFLKAKDSNGDTALHICSRAGKIDCVKKLLNACKMQEQPETQDYHFWFRRKKRNTTYIYPLVVEKNNKGDTALHCACQCTDSRIIAMLMDHGSNICSQNNQKKNPLHVFLSTPTPIENSILAFGHTQAKVWEEALKQTDNSQRTPIELAVQSLSRDKTHVMKVLLGVMAQLQLEEDVIKEVIKLGVKAALRIKSDPQKTASLLYIFINFHGYKVTLSEPQPAVSESAKNFSRFNKSKTDMAKTPGALQEKENATEKLKAELQKAEQMKAKKHSPPIKLKDTRVTVVNPKHMGAAAYDDDDVNTFYVFDKNKKQIMLVTAHDRAKVSAEFGSFIQVDSTFVPNVLTSEGVQAVLREHRANEQQQEEARFAQLPQGLHASAAALKDRLWTERTDSDDTDSDSDDSDTQVTSGTHPIPIPQTGNQDDVLLSFEEAIEYETPKVDSTPKPSKSKSKSKITDVQNYQELYYYYLMDSIKTSTGIEKNILHWAINDPECSEEAFRCLLTLDVNDKIEMDSAACQRLRSILLTALREKNDQGLTVAQAAQKARGWNLFTMRPEGSTDPVTKFLKPKEKTKPKPKT